MKQPRKPPRPTEAIKIVNLEAGMPSTHDAVAKLIRELATAKQHGHFALKVIHGYGSSGVGGDIRIAVQKRLHEMRGEHQIRGLHLRRRLDHL